MLVHIPKVYIFENINCYEMTRRCSPLVIMLASPKTQVVYPWSVHCKCVLVQRQRRNLHYILDFIFIFTAFSRLTLQLPMTGERHMCVHITKRGAFEFFLKMFSLNSLNVN